MEIPRGDFCMSYTLNWTSLTWCLCLRVWADFKHFTLKFSFSHRNNNRKLNLFWLLSLLFVLIQHGQNKIVVWTRSSSFKLWNCTSTSMWKRVLVRSDCSQLHMFHKSAIFIAQFDRRKQTTVQSNFGFFLDQVDNVSLQSLSDASAAETEVRAAHFR